MLLSFSVKLPVYGLHFWLPIAHVEAPTSGSIVLAGILLKLGGCALVRFGYVVDYSIFTGCLSVYVIFSLVVVSIVASFQSDFKRLVAYSSVVHMTVLVIRLFSGFGISSSAFLIIMVFHGFVSPLMFIMVGLVYKIASSRILAILHGSFTYSYLISLLLVFMFLMNVPTPPFSSFLAEVAVFLGLTSYLWFVSLFVFAYIFLAIVFNVYWLSSVVFGSFSAVYVTSSKATGFLESITGIYVTSFMLFSVLLIGTF